MNPYNNDVAVISRKWRLPAQNFVYHHSERIAIRVLRLTVVFEAELLRVKELRTHPSARATLYE